MKNSKFLYMRLVLVTLFWGGAFVAGRFAGQNFDPYVIAFGRFLVAAIVLLIILWKREGRFTPINGRQALLILAASLTGIVAYNLLFFRGLQLIEANRASLIIALNPVVIMGLAAMLGVERMTPVRLSGIVVALFGVGIVLTGGNLAAIGTAVGLGELLLIGCVLSWSAYTLIGRKLLNEISSLAITTYSVVLGTIALALLANKRLVALVGTNLTDWWPMIYLALFATVLGFVWYYDGVKEIGPTRAGIFINLVPGWAVLLSALLLGEKIKAATLLGGTLIVLGVLLANRQQKEKITS